MNKRVILDVARRIIVPMLGGAIWFLIARYIGGDEDAARYGITLAVVPSVFLILQYLWIHWLQARLKRGCPRWLNVDAMGNALLFVLIVAALLAAHFGFGSSYWTCKSVSRGTSVCGKDINLSSKR
jgi:hypothetical protein